MKSEKHKEITISKINGDDVMSPEPVVKKNDNRRDEIKRGIMAATLKLLYHNGYNAVTIKNIAKSMNMETYTLNSIYSSPVEILTDVIQWAIRFSDTLHNELATTADPRRKIEKYIIMHFAFLSANPEMTTLLLADESISGSRRLHNKLRQLRSNRINLLKDILQEGIADVLWVSGDVEQLTLLILGYMRMTIAAWKQSNSRESLYLHGKTAAQFIQEILYSKIKNNKGV